MLSLATIQAIQAGNVRGRTVHPRKTEIIRDVSVAEILAMIVDNLDFTH
jgi:hypothetical protein